MDWGWNWLFGFNAVKTQPVFFFFDQSNNTGASDVKTDYSVIVENSSFKMLGLSFFPKLDWGTYIISTTKTASKKTGTLIRSISFFLLRLLCISINLPYSLAWNIVVMSGLLLLAATWKC